MRKFWFLVLISFLLVHCGSGTGTGGSAGSGAVVNLQIQNPDPNSSGTAKAVLKDVGDDLSASKATTTLANLSTCTLTVTASGMSTISKSFSVSASSGTITTSLDVPQGASRTFAVDCSDGSATTQSITVGYNGSATTDLSASTTSVSLNPQFKNLISDSSDVVHYIRLNQENATQTKLTVGFGSVLTAAQKNAMAVLIELDTAGTRTSLGTISAGTSNGFVTGTKATPYMQINGGTDKPAGYLYNADGTRKMKMKCSWGTNDSSNTEISCTFGIRQMKVDINSAESGQWAAVGSLTGASPWDELPNNAKYAKYDLSPNTNDGDVASLISDTASCSTSRNGETCTSGFCNTAGACVSMTATSYVSTSDTVATIASGTTFNTPAAVCISPDGNSLYVAEDVNSTLYKVIPRTSVVSTVATGAANLNVPIGCIVDLTETNIYVVEGGGHRVRKVVAATGVVSNLAGSGTAGSADGTGAAATFNQPSGIVIDPTGTNLYVSEIAGHVVRKIVISSGVVTTVAGTAWASGSVNATGTAASFNQPANLAIDSTGTNLYVADTGNNRIRQIVISSGVVTTYAGSTAGAANGALASATFAGPFGIVMDPLDQILYVSDNAGNRIRKIAIDTGTVSTIAGTGTAGIANGTGSSATFSAPQGMAIAPYGDSIFIADQANGKIRSIVP